jgi:ATP-dependent DNA helicase RecG
VKAKGRITNREHQQLSGVAKPSATRDLADLVARGVFKMVGRGRRDLHYILDEPKVTQTQAK